MIYFIVTTSVYDNCSIKKKQCFRGTNNIYDNYSIRKTQYIKGINKLKNVIQDLNIENYKIIIIENNGKRSTFLDSLDCEVYYTENNFMQTGNIGIIELQDILDCINKYNINDTDFIVKMTGRYILDDNSEFMNVIKNIHTTNYECVIKYGCYSKPVNYKTNNCVTGLIGMLCLYVKQIEIPNGYDSAEWKWAKVTNLIDDKKIYLVNNLGINICPGCNNYFKI